MNFQNNKENNVNFLNYSNNECFNVNNNNETKILIKNNNKINKRNFIKFPFLKKNYKNCKTEINSIDNSNSNKKNKLLINNNTFIESKKNFNNESTLKIIIKNDENVKKKFNLKQFYNERESNKLVNKEGPTIFKFLLKEINLNLIPDNFLNIKNISENLHLRMIDWMVEVLDAYTQSNETFFLAVHILDLFIFKSESFSSNDIHLLGIVSMFLASKFEDVNPICLQQIISKIGHNIFKKEEILNYEKKICKTLNFNFYYVCCFDIIKTFYHDFKSSNKESIKENNAEELLIELNSISIYLCKMIFHFNYFYRFSELSKAIAILMSSISVLKVFSNRFDYRAEQLFTDWIIYIQNENNLNSDLLINLHYKINEAYEKFKLLSPNQEKVNLDIYEKLEIK